MQKFQKNLIIILLVATMVFSVFATAYAQETSNYTIEWGDSLFEISQKFKVDISTLVQLNNLDNPNLILSGNKIKLSIKDKESNSMEDTTSKKAESKQQEGDSTKNTDREKNKEKDQSKTTIPKNETKEKKQTETEIPKKNTGENDESKTEIPEKSKQIPKKVYRKKPKTMKIALTFDDGPDAKYTPQVLEVLKEYKVKATFFLVGKRVKKHPEVVKQIVEDGHTIGNHSWAHADLTSLNAKELQKDIKDTENIIEKVIDQETSLIRPPYGAISNGVLTQLQDMNYRVIHWSVDSLDWKAKEKNEVIENTLSNLHPGAIILLHSAGGEGQSLTPTVEALPVIIEYMRKQNYEFVTADELLSVSAYRDSTTYTKS